MPPQRRLVSSLVLVTLAMTLSCGLRDEATSRKQAVVHARVDDNTPLPVPPDTMMAPDLYDATNKVVAGSLPGSATVAADGEARYSIPLWVPPGRAGMQPSLSLEYRSGGGNGLAGVGWSLAGLSQINRCPHSVAVDGSAGPVRYDANDAYCLDGQRLIRIMDGTTSGSRWGFHTERDIFAQIYAAVDATKGATHFTSYEKGGLIRDYSAYHVAYNGAYSSWMLTQVQDRYGNTIKISYEDVGGYLYPTEIDYTGSLTNPALNTTNRAVKFAYETRTNRYNATLVDTEYSAASGSSELRRRLSGVEMWGPDGASASTLLRAYTLSYSSSLVNGRSLLTSVAVSDPSGNKLSDTSFEYEGGSPGFTSYPAYITEAENGFPFRLIDVNGDGKSDIVYMTKDQSGHYELSARIWDPFNFRFGDRSELHLGGDPDIFNTINPPTPLLAQTNIPSSIIVWEPIAGGNTTQPVVQQLDSIGPGVYPGAFIGLPPTNEFPFAADFDGDGLADILQVTAVAGPPYQQTFTLRTNRRLSPADFNPGVNVNIPANWPSPAWNSFGVTMPFRAVDFDGDGRQELPACPEQPSTYSGPVLLVRADGGATSGMVSCGEAGKHVPLFVDVNGDGLDDVIFPDDVDLMNKQAIKTVLNVGPKVDSGASPPQLFMKGQKLAGAVRTIDYNLDGRPDLIATINNSSSVISVFTSTVDASGITLTKSTDTIGPDLHANQDPNALEVGDLNGDGLQDYVIWDRAYNAFTVYIRNGKRPDMLTRVVDGYGAETKFTYAPIGDGVVYKSTKPVTDELWPLRLVQTGAWVVRQHSVSNGTAKGAATTYFHTYEDGLEDVAGRGFLGFNAHEVTESGTGWTRNLRQEFDNGARPSNGPEMYVGLPTHEIETVTLAGGTILSRETIDRTYAWKRPFSDFTAYFPYAQVTEINAYEDNAGTLAQTYHQKITINDIDFVGNVKNQSVEEGSGEVRTTDVTYQYDYNNWLVNEPIVISDVGHIPNGEATTRRRAYKYNSSGSVEWSVIEPNLDANNNITPLPQPQPDGVASLFVHYLRDADGQISSVTTDNDFATSAKQRSVTMFYDDADRTFATRVKNKLGHMVHYAFHPGYGLLAAKQDERGVYSRWRYDRFGRLKRAEPGEGEPSSLAYVGYVGLGANDAQGNPKPSLEVDRNGDAKEVFVTQYDLVGQAVLDKQRTRDDGAWVSVDRQFDVDGLLTSVSRPHFDGGAKKRDTFTYDGDFRLRKKQLADGRVQQIDFAGPRTDVWDADSTNAAAIRRSLVHDLSGHVSSTIEHAAAHGGRPARDLTISFGYGPFDVVESMVNVDKATTTTSYDRLGRALTTIDPTDGRKDFGLNVFGEPETITVNKNSGTPEIRTLTYDDVGRKQVLTDRDGTTTWTWDTGVNGMGALGSVATSNGVNVALDYGAKGEVAQLRWTVGSETFAVDHVVDSFGRPQLVRYPTVNGGRFTARYEYGAHGSLRDIVNDADSTQVFWTTLEADAGGAATNPSGAFPQYRLGSNIVVRNVEDSTHPGLLGAITGMVGTKTIQSLAYSYDGKGNLWKKHDASNALDETYEYDELDRLERWRVSAAEGPSVVRFDYTDSGNRVGRTYESGGGTSHTWQYDGSNGAGPYGVTGADGTSTYHYDLEGNERNGPGRADTFAAFGLPTNIHSNVWYPPAYDFLYDGLGSRVQKTVTIHQISGNRTITTLSLGGYYTRTVDSSATGATHAYTIVGPVGPIAQITTTDGGAPSAPQYVLRDHLGSAEEIVDGSSGSVVETRKFDPFGLRIDPSAPATGTAPAATSSLPFGFAGHEHDWDLGLINMQARLYDPQLGRFLSPDHADGGLTAGALNPYAYVRNNPTNAIDPSGRLVVIIGGPGGDPGSGGGGFGPSPDPLPGGPPGATPLPIPQPPRRPPAPTGGTSGTGPFNAADATARRIAESNAQAHLTAADTFGETLRIDPHYEGFRQWSDFGDQQTTLLGKGWAAWNAGWALAGGVIGRTLDEGLGLLGRAVEYVDPDGSVGLAAQQVGMELAFNPRVETAGMAVSEIEAGLTGAANYSRWLAAELHASEEGSLYLLGSGREARAAQLAENVAQGNAWRDELANLLEQAGRVIRKEVTKWTPLGRRRMDIEVWDNGVCLGGIECKVGGSPYTFMQHWKDMYLQLVHGYRVNVARKPPNW